MEKHIPVLKKECIELLNIKSGGIYVDGTAGRGGHVEAILEAAPNVRVAAIDKDPVNAEFLTQRFKGKDVVVVNADYKDLDDILSFHNIKMVDGLLLDLGFSSIHIDDAERGFSFSKDGPLDMRYNRSQDLTAEIIVNEYDEHALKKIIREYGEEPFYNRVVRAIIEYRTQQRIRTTFELKKIINGAIPSKGWSPKKIDASTKTFQALRIEVNSELESLKTVLEKVVPLLNVGGRICIITFHSLEDRIVKTKFNNEADPCTCPKGLVQCVCGKKPRLKVITKKVLVPEDKEIHLNPRARSAKLRAAEKL
jgi:16S rRNA (cytosine1402-N4)-methyltransferase